MKLKKTSIRIAVIALLLGLLFFSLKYFFFSPTPPEYLTAPVIRMDIEDVVLASGTIQPIQYVNVGAQVTGQLKTLAVKLGDHVKKGQLLAEIDPVIAQNDLRKAQSTLAQV
ncbi:MAG: biotin/lipoyl-binding protein [Ottowia sp.]|nr:biotin/lipoyl-binding protein [Ottowia sp.]